MTFLDIQKELFSAVKALQSGNFSSWPILWPNQANVDFEKMKNPVIQVQIVFADQTEARSISDKALIKEGTLLVSILNKANSGTMSDADFVDKIETNICNKVLGKCQTLNMRVYPVSPFPGVVGTQAAIKFRAVN